MKFGIIGTGSIGGIHAQAIGAMSGSELYGVADRDAARARTFVQQHGGRAFDSVEALVNDPDIDIVTVATPSGVHLEPALAALEAGKHVVVEKPLEITPERIDILIEAAKSHGVTLAAVLNRRFHPAMDVFKRAVEQGRFGRLTSASAYVKWYRSQAYYDDISWHGTWALDGGGALMNQSIHAVDALLHLAGPVAAVQASTACLGHENIEVEDIGVALLEFQSGARGVLEGSTCTWSAKGQPARIQLAGMRGFAQLADDAIEIWDFMDTLPEDEAIRANAMSPGATGLGALDPGAIDFHQHQRNFEEVVAAIQQGREPSTAAAVARRSVALICAIYESARNDGEKVTLADA